MGSDKRHPDELISTLIENGQSAACYDGQYFFDTDHAEGDSGTQSNKLTYDVTTPATPTTAEFAAAFRAARKALRDFKDDRGKPFNQALPGLMCMVPTGMESAAEEVFNSQIIADTSNVLAGSAELVVNPLLSATDRFYLFVTGNAVRPIIFQERRGITTAGLREDGEPGFFRKNLYFGVDARYNGQCQNRLRGTPVRVGRDSSARRPKKGVERRPVRFPYRPLSRKNQPPKTGRFWDGVMAAGRRAFKIVINAVVRRFLG